MEKEEKFDDLNEDASFYSELILLINKYITDRNSSRMLHMLNMSYDYILKISRIHGIQRESQITQKENK